MGIQSMTGFGKQEVETEDTYISIELKSVNNRFKDIRLKLPQQFLEVELDLRKKINQSFSRGSFDVYFTLKKTSNRSKFDDVDIDKINQYLSKVNPILKDLNTKFNISPTDFLRSEFQKDFDRGEIKKSFPIVLDAMDKAIFNLRKSRESEGEKLVVVLKNHLEEFENNLKIIKSNEPNFRKDIEQRLKKKFNDFKLESNFEEGRFLQEVVFYLEKLDINEETSRIVAHLEELKSILNEKGAVGRKIEFLLQELHRETNTIGSKSQLYEISDSIVKMKMQLEKIREQALNIE